MLRWSKNGCPNKSVQNDVLKVCSSLLHAIQVIVLLSVTGLMLLSVLLKLQGWKVAMGHTNNSNIVLPFPYSLVITVEFVITHNPINTLHAEIIYTLHAPFINAEVKVISLRSK